MGTYVLLTRVSPDALKEPATLEELSKTITGRIRKEAPAVKWLANYAVLGPYDYLDIFEAPDDATAARVAVIIRSYGHATTETWPAIPWEGFVQTIRGL